MLIAAALCCCRLQHTSDLPIDTIAHAVVAPHVATIYATPLRLSSPMMFARRYYARYATDFAMLDIVIRR